MRRKGFTLIELLVAIAIIGVLVAILLPAVQAARQASRRTQCQNHLKQLALAAHNYSETVGCLPSAFTGGFELHLDDKRWGWGTFLLPYLDQANLYDSLDPSTRSLFSTVFDTSRNGLLQTPLSIYRCPSDIGPALSNSNRDFTGPPTATTADLLPQPEDGTHFVFHLNHVGFRAATSNYVANFGDFWRPNYALWDDTELAGNGTMGCNTRVTFQDITDGPSQTFLFGERTYSNHAAVWGGVEAWNRCTSFGVSMVAGSAYYEINGTPALYPYTCDGGASAAFSSEHAGGANFALADGSVRFISESIDSRNRDNVADPNDVGVFQRLANRQDGNPLGDF